tara:strand:- start:15623 stop:17824 length:2202 start_codon:yes stop_codon:yes gene_type:complete
MANSKIPTVQLTDTFNTQRNRFNSLVDSVGDVSTLTTTSKEVTGAIKELDAELGTITAGAMGTTATTVSTAIGEIDGRLDSINTTQLLSPRMTLSDSSANNIIRGKLQIDGGITSLSASNLTLDSDLTVHGIANLDSTNVVGQLDVTGSITATNFTVSGAFTTAGATRNAASFVVTNDGATVTNTNRAGLAVDRPSLDSAVIQWNELGDFWEIGTNQTDGGASSDLKRVARQNDSAVFTNLMQSGTGATRIPAGTTAQRPSSEQGQIRYNTTNASFEGYSGSAWSGLGGLIDVDGDTKVLAERSAGNDSDTLTFFTGGVERLRMNDSGSTFATNISGAGLTLSGNITMVGGRTVDGYDVSSLGSKLAGIETGATADQTAAQIKTAYEGNANTEAFTTALQSKLNGIANSANNFTYTLPTAAAGTKGGVKVGSGLSISSEVLSHTDTSSQASSNNSGRTYIQDITLDTYGHVTGLATASESVVNTDTNTTYTGGTNISLSGTQFNLDADLSGISTISSTGDMFLRATGDDIHMQGTSSSEEIRFGLENSTQEIHASDALTVMANTTAYIKSGFAIQLGAGNGLIDLGQYADGADPLSFDQDIRFDVATTDTLKIYTGTSTLNSTFSGDDLTVQGDVNSLSDVRTKENIVTVESGLDLVSQLRGVWYNKIGSINILDGKPEGRKVGVIAQEVEKVLPEVVSTDGDGMKAVDYGKMVGVLIEAIKELKQEIEELKG